VIVVTESAVDADGLLNSSPLSLRVQMASGHVNRATYDSAVTFNLGTHSKASVLENNKLVDSLCGIAPLADSGLISIFHPDEGGVL